MKYIHFQINFDQLGFRVLIKNNQLQFHNFAFVFTEKANEQNSGTEIDSNHLQNTVKRTTVENNIQQHIQLFYVFIYIIKVVIIICNTMHVSSTKNIIYFSEEKKTILYCFLHNTFNGFNNKPLIHSQLQ